MLACFDPVVIQSRALYTVSLTFEKTLQALFFALDYLCLISFTENFTYGEFDENTFPVIARIIDFGRMW